MASSGTSWLVYTNPVSRLRRTPSTTACRAAASPLSNRSRSTSRISAMGSKAYRGDPGRVLARRFLRRVWKGRAGSRRSSGGEVAAREAELRDEPGELVELAVGEAGDAEVDGGDGLGGGGDEVAAVGGDLAQGG